MSRFDLSYRLPQIKNRLLQDPHVVIVGAGATIAACPVDKSGKKVPALRDIHKILGLEELLLKYGFSKDEMEDFEALFSSIAGMEEYSDLQELLESRVKEYFKSLVIPDEPTLYDYLLLSLTQKDAIISFNWDPFLMQAYKRNISVGNLPQVFFPHGNTGVGLCYKCRIKQYSDCLCPKCYEPLTDMKLLYPVKQKKYQDGEIIENEWNMARDYLQRAAGVTIWGYGAPETDIEALNLLRDAYIKSDIRMIAPFTIVNLESCKKDQLKKWETIYDGKMLQYTDSFKQTLLWQNPRVSLETLFDAILQQHPRKEKKGFYEFESLEALQQYVQTITEFEMYFE